MAHTLKNLVRSLFRSLLAAGILAGAAGCNIDIIRFRGGNPLKEDEFAKLEVQKTTRNDAVDRLGVPEKLEWKNGKEYLWYLYQDSVDTGIRFQFPPFRSILGYQHTFLRLDEGAEDVNAMELVFDDRGVLERKSLRLSEAYHPPEDSSGWKLHLSAHADRSALLQGDAGIRNYDEVFKNGYRAGLSIGWQPMPVVTLLGRGSYQEHQGDSFRTQGGSRISFDDLQLLELELGLRLAAPLSLIWTFTDYENVRKVLFEEDLSRSTGFRFYIEGTTGVTHNNHVPVKINAVPAGNFYDDDWGFSGTLEAGLEYGGRWGEAHLGITFQTVDPFNPGNSPLRDNGDAFQAVLLGGGVSLKL